MDSFSTDREREIYLASYDNGIIYHLDLTSQFIYTDSGTRHNAEVEILRFFRKDKQSDRELCLPYRSLSNN